MAERIPTKRIRVRILTGNESGDDTIELNFDDDPLQLEVELRCRMSVKPTNNRAVLAIKNLSEASRLVIAGVVSEKLDFPDVLTTRTNNADGSVSIRIASTKELIPQGFTKKETIRAGDAFVEIDAGVDDRVSRVFEGSSKRAEHGYSQGTWVTTLDIGDGLSTTMQATARGEFDPGVELFDVVSYIVKSMALDPGNFTRAQLLEAVGANVSSIFPDGFTVAGDSVHLLDEMLRNSGAEWWADRGRFYVVKEGAAVNGRTIVFDEDSGLRAAPRPLGDGGVLVISDARLDARVGHQARLEARILAGDYRIEEVEHSLNNRAGEWASAVVMRPLTPIVPGVL